MDTKGMYFRSIQFLRFFAAVYITLYHLGPWWYHKEPGVVANMFGNAHGAVDLFFVISGFVIIQAALGSKTGWYPFLVFLKKRLIRIYPIYWVLLLFFLVTGIIDASNKTSWQFWHAFFLLPRHGGFISPSWSLSWELYFYSLTSLLVLDRRFKYFFGIVMLLAFTRMAMQIVPLIHLPEIGAYNHYVAEFFIGMLAWKIHDKVRVVLGVIVAVIGAIYFLFPVHGSFSNAFTFGIPAALLIIGLTALEKQGRLIVPLPLARLGDASYCMYLIHLPLIKAVLPNPATSPFTNRWILITFVIALIVLSVPLHVFVEKPLMRFLNNRILPNAKLKEKGR